MNEESRRNEPFSPYPLLGLDLGERWGREVGELSQRLANVDGAVARLELKTEALDARFDTLALSFVRLDERLTAMEQRTAERFDNMEKRTAEQLAAMEKRTAERFENMEQRTAERFENMEKRTAERFDNMEKRTDEKFASLEKALNSHAKFSTGLFLALMTAIIVQKFI